MQKIYVLLRGDQQTGPYSLQEMIQFDLKPYDLIWIEGKSAGWYYPQEIEALHPYLSFMQPKPETSKPAAAKTIHVTMPATPEKEEPKSEPPVAEPAAFSLDIPQKPLSNFDEDFYTKFTKTTAGKQESLTDTAARAKPGKKSSLSVGGAIIAVLIIGGVFAASWMMSSGSQKETVSSGEASQAAQVQNEITSTPDEANHFSNISASFPKNSPAKENVSKRTSTSLTKQNAQKKEEQDFTADDLPNETGNNPAPASEDEQTSVENDPGTIEEKGAPQEKKKKLRDKILDIFKKQPEEKQEEAKRAEEENGERKPVYREGSANLAQQVSIRLTIPNNWMMGIKGAKATLYNKSHVTIAKAIVDVLYYDDENALLQKKTITFSRIDGKETQTVSIPDHPTATKVEYTIVLVEGKPAA